LLSIPVQNVEEGVLPSYHPLPHFSLLTSHHLKCDKLVLIIIPLSRTVSFVREALEGED
jgi:hypothetical protein